MRTIHLSDHASDLLQAGERFLAVARGDRDANERRWREATASHRRARAGRPRWRQVVGLSTAEERAARYRLDQVAADRSTADRRVAELERQVRRRAEEAGQERTLDEWLTDLSDEWTIVHGYRNRAGAIDRLLVGPGGVWAFGVATVRARLYVDGEDWRYETGADGGTCHRGGPAADDSGRSWGRLVAEPAAGLASYLATRGQASAVRTAVVLLHPRARVVRRREVPIDLVTADRDEVRDRIATSGERLPTVARDAVIGLIRRSHRVDGGSTAPVDRRTLGPAAEAPAGGDDEAADSTA